ncbi:MULTISPECIES: hypothetical protein [Zhongshania]|jgi:hypothetical protein|uniref:Uncharacterized protein n=1 Tax=Zhongshania antarctica TaxID=641702 RepID=A0A840R543_9GAMM|nr:MULTISPECIES: hypothetical protein [Zhongshania]MBB5187542.1 hypothetical protein [Zhongshania antarctica]
MKKHCVALTLLLSISAVSHAQDLLSGALGPLSGSAIPSLNLLDAGLPTSAILGGLTPLAIDTVNTALPLVNSVLVSTLPLVTDLSSSVLAGLGPVAIDGVNTALPLLNGVLASGLLDAGIPLVGGDLTAGLLPIAIDLVNTAVPVLATVL